MNRPNLPKDFIIGSATASYQVEGAGFEDGRTSCIWDDFSRIPGKVWCGENGSVAADQYHHIKEDIALMAKLGLQAYRFSISWPRVLPHGGHKINEKGIQYYKDLCDELHKVGIKAYCTLYHWDLPSELEEMGGWTNRGIVKAFKEYAELMFKELGDKVDMWFTLNEQFCMCYLGYGIGVHAPGKSDLSLFAKAVHYSSLAHGEAVRSYRETGLKAPIGIVWNPTMPRPATKRKEDVEASLYARAIESEIYIHPVFGKGYPERVTKDMGISFPIEEGDMEIIATPIDVYGVNYYNERPVEADSSSPFLYKVAPSWEDVTDGMEWPIVEKGLERLILWLDETSNHHPLFITENGSAENDIVTPEGRIHDKKRIDYIAKHLNISASLIEKGVPLKGYLYWSFIDNYEWSYGYEKRFGLVYCDYHTLHRIPKDSAYYLRDIIAGFGDY